MLPQMKGHCFYAPHHAEPLTAHFFYKIPRRIAVIMHPCRGQFIGLHHFHEPRCHIAVIDRIACTRAQPPLAQTIYHRGFYPALRALADKMQAFIKAIPNA